MDVQELKSIKFSTEFLTWNQLFSFVTTIQDPKILNTGVVSIEHHHSVRIRFYPELLMVDEIPVLIPSIGYMYTYREPDVQEISPYHSMILELESRYPEATILSCNLTYSKFIELVRTQIPSNRMDQPISIFDIWDLDPDPSLNNKKELCHFAPYIEIPLHEHNEAIKEIQSNTHRTPEQRDEEVTSENEIFDNSQILEEASIDYFLENPQQPRLSFDGF